MKTPTQDPQLTATISAVFRFMSADLREELYHQFATKTPRYGSNVRVELPSGALADELRRISIELITCGAIIRGGKYTGTLQKESHDLSLVFHYSAVSYLLKQDDAYRFIQEAAVVRLVRIRPYLYGLLLQKVNDGFPHAVWEARFKDAVSVQDVGFTVDRMYGNYRDPVPNVEMDREVLKMVRFIIAPYNEEHADVRICFSSDGVDTMTMTINGKHIWH